MSTEEFIQLADEIKGIIEENKKLSLDLHMLRVQIEGFKHDLKNMPHWRVAEADNKIGCLVWDKSRGFHLYMDKVKKGELYIPIHDVLCFRGGPRYNEESPIECAIEKVLSDDTIQFKWTHQLDDYIAQVKNARENCGYSYNTWIWNCLLHLEDDLSTLKKLNE